MTTFKQITNKGHSALVMFILPSLKAKCQVHNGDFKCGGACNS